MDKACLNAPVWHSMQNFENFTAQPFFFFFLSEEQSQNGPMKCHKTQNKIIGPWLSWVPISTLGVPIGTLRVSIGT